jgi:hypothetical protein
MIHFVGIHPPVIEQYVGGWGRPIADRLRVMSYARLARSRRLAAGTYVFCDVDRVPGVVAEDAARVAAHLTASGVRVLNHPLRSLKRYELLRTLNEQGINRFNVYHATEARWPTRYPVFLREASTTARTLGPLLPTRAALEAELAERIAAGRSRDDTLIVEFCDTADDQGVYRKYSAFVVGARIIPAHIACSKDWVTKAIDLRDEVFLEEERRFVRENPHEARLREIFALAGIDFGRIDYAVLDGDIQVWEINTDPWLIAWVPQDLGRLVATEESARRFNAALVEIDADRGLASTRNPLRWPLVRKRWRRAIRATLASFGRGDYEPTLAMTLVGWQREVLRRLRRLRSRK